MLKKIYSLVLLAIFTTLPAVALQDYQTDFTAEDFKNRRAAVYTAIGDNLAIIQGAADVEGFIVFRQSNTFYYLSGLETANAYMLLDGRSKRTTIYLPHRNEERENGEGKKFSYEDGERIKELTGVYAVRPVEKMAVDFARPVMRAPVPALYTPHSPAEGNLQSRDEILYGQGRNVADPWDGRPSRVGQFINLIKTRYPQFEVRDLTPALDIMKSIKDEKEIELIRKASQIAGMGIMEAMRSTKPDVMEYQLEAAAKFVFFNNGARGLSYNAIVGGGQNAWMGHYSANSDAVKDGDLILMDLAPDYRYYTSDVTRMWPVNGKYTKDQRDLYGFVVEYHKAFLRHLRPGVTPQQVLTAVWADMRKVLDATDWSNDMYREAAEAALSFRGHIQHPVGMSVHDVGTVWNGAFKEGMVFSIDPMVWVHPEKQYIRMEDIVVITKDGAENLSGNLPIELDAIEALIAEEGIVQKRPAVFN